jgi:hypothetical protein
MNTHANKTQENKTRSAADNLSKHEGNSEQALQFIDERPEAVAQRKLPEAINHSPRALQLRSYQQMADNASRTRQLKSDIPSSTSAPVQREVNENLTNVTEVTAITAEVFSVTHEGGEVIIKFKGELVTDSIADNSLRAAGAAAPESKLVSAQFLLERLPAEGTGPGDTNALRAKLLERGDTPVYVAEKLKGEALGPDASTVSEKTRRFLADPRFAFDLGKVAAYDTLLGHQDRVLGGLNFGNMFTPKPIGLQQIDNQIQDNDFWIKRVGLDDLFQSFLENRGSVFAIKIARVIEGAHGVSGFPVGIFQEGFVTGLQQFLEKQGELMAYLKTQEEPKIRTILGNTMRLHETLSTSELFVAAVEKINMAKREMLETATAEKEKTVSSSGSGGFMKTLSNFFSRDK